MSDGMTSTSAMVRSTPAPDAGLQANSVAGEDGDNGRVSFDLTAFPSTGPRTVPEVRQLLDDEEQRLVSEEQGPTSATDDALAGPGPEMARFLDELGRRWPSLEDDPDRAPWSCSPLWQPTIGDQAIEAIGMAIRWSRAEEMYTAIVEIAARTNVIIYDPQGPEVICPPE